MTLLQRLQTHRGGLLRIETQLFWYIARCWDKNPGRICLVLDAALPSAAVAPGAPRRYAATRAAVAYRRALTRRILDAGDLDADADALAAVHLLVDGQPQWIWVAEADVEILDGGDR